VMHHLGSTEPGFLVILESVVNKEGIEKKRPRSIPANSTAIVVLQLDRTVCCQVASIVPSIGNFLLRRGSESIASGMILAI
jgi:translation elongation factor EF-1alpha